MSSTTSIPLATPRSPGMARSQPTDEPPRPVDIGVVTLASRGCSLDATVAYGGVMVDDIEITLVNDTPSPAAFDVVVVEHGHWYRDLEIVVDYQQHLIQAGDGALDGRRTPLPLPRWARRVARVDVEPNSSGTADAVPIAGFLAVVCHRVFESRAITAPAGIVGPVELLVRGPAGETRTSIEAPTAAPDGRRPDTTSATMASSDASSVGTVTQAGGGACSIDPPVPTVTAAQFDITLVNEATIQLALFEVYRVETGYTRRDLAVIVDYQRELLRDLPAVYRPASPPPPPQWSVRVWSVTVPPGSSVTSPTLTANGTLVVVCHRSYDVGGIAYPESVVGPVAVLPPPSEAVLVAESFMDAWIVGDLPTALSYFGPRGTYDDDAVGVLVGLRRWYEAVVWEARHAGCAPLSEADPLPRARVACPYEFENDLTRLRPERSVGGLLLLTVDQSGILDAVDAYTADLLADAWYAFRHWLASTHPDDIDHM